MIPDRLGFYIFRVIKSKKYFLIKVLEKYNKTVNQSFKNSGSDYYLKAWKCRSNPLQHKKLEKPEIQ